MVLQQVSPFLTSRNPNLPFVFKLKPKYYDNLQIFVVILHKLWVIICLETQLEVLVFVYP